MSPTLKKARLYKYLDPSRFEIGVPTRDLTVSEFESLENSVQEKLLKAKLYAPADEVESVEKVEG